MGCGIEAYIELKPEFKGILGVLGAGGLPETLPALPVPLLPFPGPDIPFPVPPT